MATNRLKSFTVMAKVEIDCTIPIKAESLEDAVKKSVSLKETDFVKILGDFMDGKLNIYGCYGDDD